MSVSGIFIVLGFVFLGVPFLIWLQLKLSASKNRAKGLALILIIFVLGTAVSIWAWNETSGYEEVLLSAELDNGLIAEARVKLDKEGRVIASTEMEIKDEDGRLLNVVPWDQTGYGDLAMRLKDGYQINSATPPIYEEMEEVGRSLYIGRTAYNVAMFPFMTAFAVVPLLVIYLLRRREIYKKRKAEEIRRVKIESL